jgi:glyoxylase-like metal-dependent hydrolase (beta-lactamase superfamily II)
MKRIRNVTTWCFALAFVFYGVSAQAASPDRGLTKMSDTVYSYVDVKGASPQNSFGANAGIIIGRDGIVVVDTLTSAKEATRLIRDIRKITNKPIRYVINTHYHLDHALGNSEFVKLGATVVSHANEKTNMKNSAEITLKRAGDYGLGDEDMKGTVVSLPAITFTDRMEIDLGDRKIELIYPGPSHTNGSILVYLPDERLLFSGDVLFTNYHPNLRDGDIESWIRVLDNISAMDVIRIIPGHGPESTKKDVAHMKSYLIIFDKKARELTAQSNDIGYITSEMKKVLPARAELDMLIQGSLQNYLRK